MGEVPTLTTSRLKLRGWREEDREPFAAMNADPRVMAFLLAPLSRSKSDALVDRIEESFTDGGYGLWAVERRDTGAFIGFTGLSLATFEAPFTPAVEIGWRLAADHWRRGFATEAATESLRFGFDTLGLPEIVSFTAKTHVRSCRVMERIGMTRDRSLDFDHPSCPVGSPLRPHVLYRVTSERYRRRS
jgi:RimJ/RimL family protein N-acetyltransferase